MQYPDGFTRGHTPLGSGKPKTPKNHNTQSAAAHNAERFRRASAVRCFAAASGFISFTVPIQPFAAIIPISSRFI